MVTTFTPAREWPCTACRSTPPVHPAQVNPPEPRCPSATCEVDVPSLRTLEAVASLTADYYAGTMSLGPAVTASKEGAELLEILSEFWADVCDGALVRADEFAERVRELVRMREARQAVGL